MKQRLLETVGRRTRLQVLQELKRTPTGLAVGDLATRLGMSYMGVKDLCLALHKKGLLDTWRDPQKNGRPKMLYRLTEKAHELFPVASHALTIELLQTAGRLYGAAAPEKLLLLTFQKMAEDLRAKIGQGSVAERAEKLVQWRDAEGYMSTLEEGDDGRQRIVEYHTPLLELLRAFPLVARLETELFQRLLGVPVAREESTVAGLFQAKFTF